MSTSMDRRRFLGSAALSAAASSVAVSAKTTSKYDSPNTRVVLGVMGMSRGRTLAMSLGSQPNVHLKYICDVDSQRLDKVAKMLEEKLGKAPQKVTDFRRILEDPAVDALANAGPNHWHAPGTILACSAGKHVYVEKPCSHNPREGELMVQAARKYNRAVQMGTQRRSSPGTQEAIQQLHEGVIGRVYMVRTWYNSGRGTLGRGKPTAAPSHLDYDMWQGPAPRFPYKDNLIHYNWHWRWHWGGGEIANNGVHSLDVARWGLGVDLPERVTYNGGRYYYDDDQETPDTGEATFHFGDRYASWSGSSCDPRRDEKLPFCKFYGEKGSMVMRGSNEYQILDRDGKELEKKSGPGGEPAHFQNFVDAIRDKSVKLNSVISDVQNSTKLCHLANIAYRTSGAVRCDPKAGGKLIDNPEGEKLWGREYRKGWKPKV